MKKYVVIGIILTVILFIVHLFIMDQYGMTWDFFYHFFSGLYLLGKPLPPELTSLPFGWLDPRKTLTLPYGPIMTIIPTLTEELFFRTLHWLPLDNAYHLGVLFVGSLGPLVLYLFLTEAVSPIAGLFGFFFLALYPRFFAESHNNIKDICQAVAYGWAVYFFWRFTLRWNVKRLFIAACMWGVAFNTKINAYSMPIVGFLYGIYCFMRMKFFSLPKRFPKKSFIMFLFYFPLAAAFAVLMWSLFWSDPIGQLLYIPKFYLEGTQNMEVLIAGKWFCSTVNIPWWYPWRYLFSVTPVLLFFFWCIGVLRSFIRWRKEPVGTLFILWMFIPLVRFFDPHVPVLDGIRHFEETLLPLVALSAYGADYCWSFLKKHTSLQLKKPAGILFLSAVAIYLLTPIVSYHPFQHTYFSEAVGGIKGALGKFDIDYWSSSQKQAILWLNNNARTNAVVTILMAQDVGAQYLRGDLRERVNTKDYHDADYVVVLNRQSFFYRYYALSDYILTHQPAYTVKTQEVPLTWVFDNSIAETPRQPKWWVGEDPCGGRK